MEIELVRMFVKVVQHGSYSKASEILKIPKSTVSKAVTRLERESGTQLLLRTTRSQTLTAAGRAFYESCLGPIQTLEDAQKSIYGKDSIISGLIRITAPEDLGYQVLAPAIAELSRKHPQLNFELKYANEIIDLIKDGFDLAVRIGKLTESNLKARKVGELTLICVASPKYLKSVDKICAPKDLENADCLSLGVRSGQLQWNLKCKSASTRVDVKIRIECNLMSSLMRLAIAGAGVGLVPYYLCKEAIADGSLVQVLPEWSASGLPVSLVAPLSLNSSARLRVVAEDIQRAIHNALI